MIFNELMTGLNEAVGMESYVDAPMTELEEMNAEIQEMVALESALEEMEAYAILEFADNTEATNALLAMREVALESTQGMDPAKIYERFGFESEIAMEAAKDVLARKAYAGIAAIKALIATCIKWLKSLFGVTVASKKVFSSLGKKADAMKKQLTKKLGSGKIDSEKLKREVPDYGKGIEKYITAYDHHVNGVEELANKIKDRITNSTDGSIAKKLIDETEKVSERNKDRDENFYNKSETNEKTGSALVSSLLNDLDELKKIGKSDRKSKNIGKTINDTIKSLEKYRSDLDKKTADDETNLQNKKSAINAAITRLNVYHSSIKSDLKGLVKVSDDLLTMSKGVLAAIY